MNIGFLGCSKIGTKVIEAIKSIEGATLYGCSARDALKAKEYKEKYGFLKYYESYEEMLNDPQIELVYVSTLMASHYKDTLLALKHNKSCIVEKSFTMNEKEADELCFYSEKHNIFLGEAIWTRYMPSKNVIKKILKDGIIGEVFHIEANLSYPLKDVERLTNKNLGGGILLDCGVYPINFVTMFFGYDFLNISSEMIINSKFDVEESVLINMTYKSSLTATLYTSMNAITSKKGIIYGTKGYLEIDDINNPKKVSIFKTTNEYYPKLIDTIEFKEEVNGYEYEFIEVINAIKNHQIEPDSMLHSETLKIMRILDEIRKNASKVYK